MNPAPNPDRDRWPLNLSPWHVPPAQPTGEDDDSLRYVIHLPVTAADLTGAKRVAEMLATSLAFMRELDHGETTVSEENRQNVRHRVFCGRLLADRRRCARRDGHDGTCHP